MSSPQSPKRHHQTQSPFLSIAHLILPWLTPKELTSLSCTSTTLYHLSKPISAVRSSDASRSFEPFPIPFINTVDSHPYAFFLYSPTQKLLPSTHLSRQPWPTPNPNPNPNLKNPFCLISDARGCGCDCDGDEKCGSESDCPCLALRGGDLITECGPGCECGSGCENRVSQKGVSVRVNIVRDLNKGWCLFSDQFISSAQFVCEYTGELLTTKESRRRQQQYDDRARGGRFSSALLVVREHLPSRKACFRINIDATRIGNVARFINHSCDGGNLFTVLIRSAGAPLPRVCLFASRDIEAGEELSFSYGDVRLRPEGLRCFCGSSSCYGTLPSEDT